MAQNKISEMLDGVACYPFHMPGHKRNTALTGDDFPYGRDITEIAGSDNLHDASGVILSECERAARLWGAASAHILVNGSTCGILAAIRAYAGHDRGVVVARNCHKSVYHGIELCRLQPTYIYPAIDPESGICASITPAEVESALAKAPDAKLVIVTSPTYEGVISDIAGIAAVAHAHGALLLVDAAHGAHLGFLDFPAHPVSLGADVVICSLHKTLPAPTQTALALIGKGCPDPGALACQLAVFETSSPSYVLMEQAARCIRLLEQRGDELYEEWEARLASFICMVRAMRHLRLYFQEKRPACVWQFDYSKLVIGTRGTPLTGHALAQILRDEYRIEVEMAASDYVIAMTSLADTDRGFARLANALCEIDAQTAASDCAPVLPILQANAVYAPWEVADRASVAVPLEAAMERVSAEYVWAYPPGIPLLVPGERLSKETCQFLATLQSKGTELHSTCGSLPQTLFIVED